MENVIIKKLDKVIDKFNGSNEYKLISIKIGFDDYWELSDFLSPLFEPRKIYFKVIKYRGVKISKRIISRGIIANIEII